MKRVLVVGLALVAVLVVAVIALVSMIDVNRYKPDIEQAVKERTGRNLVMDGPLSLSIFPRLALALPRSSVSEFGSTAPFATIDGARVSVALWPLLRGNVEAGVVSITGLRASLLKRKDGSTNIDDLLKHAPEPTASTPASAPSTPAAPSTTSSTFELSKVELSKSQLAYVDEQTGASWTLSEIELKTGRLAAKTRTTIELSGQLSSTQQSILAKLKLGATLDIDSAASSYVDEQTGASWTLSEIELKTGRLAAKTSTTIQLSGQLSSTQQTILAKLKLGATLDIDSAASSYRGKDVNASLTGTWKGQALTATLKSQMLAWSARAIDIEKLQADASTGTDGQSVEAHITVPKLQIGEQSASGEHIQAVWKISGKNSATLSLEASGIGGNAKQLAIAKLALIADGGGTTRKFRLQLAGAGSANVEARSFQSSGLVGEWSTEDAGAAHKSVTGSLSGDIAIDVSKESIVGTLASAFDETQLQLRASLAGFSHPTITTDASVDRLNLDRYFSAAPSAASTRAAPVATRPTDASAAPAAPPVPAPIPLPAAHSKPADTPIDLSALRSFDINGSLKAGTLQVHGLKLTDLQASYAVAQGKLNVTPLRARLYGGSLSARLAAQADGNRVSLAADLANVQVEELTRALTQRQTLEGRGNLKLDLNAVGTSASAMKRSLDGTLSFALRDGSFHGLDIAKILREAQSHIGSGNTASLPTDVGQRTEFSELAGSFVINKGIARNRDLVGKSTLLTLAGEGEVNVPDQSIDYLARVTLTGTLNVPLGRQTLQLRGVTVPVHLTGPLDEMRYSIDWVGVATDTLKLQLHGLPELFKSDKLNEQIQKGLKGLLGK